MVTLLLALSALGQNFPLKVVLNNGPISRNINLVFLPDGYTSTQLDQFVEDVHKITDSMFTTSPFKSYKTYFNVYAILVPSPQSGAAHPATTFEASCVSVPKRPTVNNYFGSTFDFGGVHRLLAPTNEARVASVLADNFPLYDQVFVLVNTPYNGGAAAFGGIATASNIEGVMHDVTMHEIGHGFASLADEYGGLGAGIGDAPNMTVHNHPSVVKWKNWLGTSGVGIYEVEENPGWYRPHNNCKMRYSNSDFCAICRETFIELFHGYVDALVSYSPEGKEMFVPEGVIDFSLEVKKPEPNTLKITWLQNGVELAAGKNKTDVTVSVGDLNRGRNKLEVRVIDTTLMTRSDIHPEAHVYRVEWTIDTELVTGVEVSSVQSEYKVEIYPNPIQDELTVSYTLPKRTNVNIVLVNSDGKRMNTVANEQQEPGRHTYSIPSTQLNNNTSGLYYLVLKVDGSKLVEKLIRR